MVGHATPAVTNSTGGNSASNPNAGYNASSIPPGEVVAPATKADRAGAWFLTALFSVAALYMWWFMNTSSHEWTSRPTVLGKTGRQGRTISTIDLGSSGSAMTMTGAKEAADAEKAVYAQERERGLGVKRGSNVLSKPERSSTFSSTGIFPSDTSRHAHDRSGSFASDRRDRDSLRALPPIVERDGGGRRKSRTTGSGGGSRFREEMPSRLD
jgi:mannan endo-1,6-alpha-mannosidase